ncbi:hypothetical protein [Maribacter sp.]|uniref:hypothetical protein n=1 Tax=Maribacter sp. TaxID=1897614 RepID=UPI0025BE93AA|nr:hypothetical protein [Maribacter sp.]
MITKFWIEEKSPNQFYKEFLEQKKNNLTLWSVFANYSPNYRNQNQRDLDKEGMDEFDYPRINLAYSNTFFGFDDAGDLSYEQEEELANKKFEQYKNEISELLKQKSDDELSPKLDYRKLDANENLENIYWDAMAENPFMHEFEGNFAVWKKKEKILFLSMTKEDRELPYEINLGGLTTKKYNEILNEFNKITG